MTRNDLLAGVTTQIPSDTTNLPPVPEQKLSKNERKYLRKRGADHDRMMKMLISGKL